VPERYNAIELQKLKDNKQAFLDAKIDLHLYPKGVKKIDGKKVSNKEFEQYIDEQISIINNILNRYNT
jgi:hypothetical protein